MTCVDKKSIPIYKQGDTLIKHIGTIGQDIKSNFYFHTVSSERDIHVLLFKFDVYFMFSAAKRNISMPLDDYIQTLKVNNC